ncbi:MAG: HU family DNA-binding protein [Deltaproteobacteria bacterium]|nr:HU family DNA-binding protein [Deltaproteobacteria bacterium]MBW1910885.1 HU family DNA-binding protein [Deltaproteobacteria bacterium]
MAVKKTTKKAKTKKATTPERKITAVKEPMTKSIILNEIAGNTGLTKKQVSSVFDELAVVIERHIKKRSPGQFVLPGLLKVEVKSKPARKARKGINPFTGEEMIFKAKPASRVVKVRPLKGLKDMVER